MQILFPFETLPSNLESPSFHLQFSNAILTQSYFLLKYRHESSHSYMDLKLFSVGFCGMCLAELVLILIVICNSN